MNLDKEKNITHWEHNAGDHEIREFEMDGSSAHLRLDAHEDHTMDSILVHIIPQTEEKVWDKNPVRGMSPHNELLHKSRHAGSKEGERR